VSSPPYFCVDMDSFVRIVKCDPPKETSCDEEGEEAEDAKLGPDELERRRDLELQREKEQVFFFVANVHGFVGMMESWHWRARASLVDLSCQQVSDEAFLPQREMKLNMMLQILQNMEIQQHTLYSYCHILYVSSQKRQQQV